MLYVLVKHENLIDTDTVEVICVTDTKEKAYRQLLLEAESLYMNWEVLEDTELYKKFTDENKEVLIELSVHETIVVDW